MSPSANGVIGSVYMLWMILGYLVTGSVLVVSVGRLGGMYGRVRMYNLGFVTRWKAKIHAPKAEGLSSIS